MINNRVNLRIQNCGDVKKKLSDYRTYLHPKLSRKIIRQVRTDEIRPRPVADHSGWIHKPRNAIRCATWALNSVCLRVRALETSVRLFDSWLWLTSVIGPIETFDVSRDWTIFRGFIESICLPMESGVPDIDYNADNIYVYIYNVSHDDLFVHLLLEWN